MRILDFLLKRKVTVLSIAIAIIILFLYFLDKIPIELYPEFTYPGFFVKYYYVSGSPETIVREVTEPVEGIIYSTGGVVSVKSVTGEGRVSIQVRLSEKLDPAVARIKIRENLKSLVLPDYVFGPFFSDVEIEGEKREFMVLNAEESNVESLRSELLRIAGVRSVVIHGVKKRIIKLEPDFNKMTACGLLPSNVYFTVLDYLRKIHGVVGSTGVDVQVVDSLKKIPVSRNLTLGDLVTVVDTEIERYRFYYNGKRAQIVSIYKKKGVSALSLSRKIRKLIDPKNIVFDSGQEMEKELIKLLFTLGTGVILLFLSLFLFEGNPVKSVIILIPGIFSAIVSYVVFGFFDMSVNFLTLSGIFMGLGMLVDAMLIYGDRVGYYGEYGIVKAGSEIFFPLVASLLTTLVIFIPIIYMSEKNRYLFIPFARAIGISLLASLFATYLVGSQLINIHKEHFLKVSPLRIPVLQGGVVISLILVLTSTWIFFRNVSRGIDFKPFKEDRISIFIRFPEEIRAEETAFWNNEFRNFVESLRRRFGGKTYTYEYPRRTNIFFVFSNEQVRAKIPFTVREELEDYFKGLGGFFVVIRGFSPEAFILSPSREELLTLKIKGYRYDSLIKVSRKVASVMKRYPEFARIKPVYDPRGGISYSIDAKPDPEITFYLSRLRAGEWRGFPVFWWPDPVDTLVLKGKFHLKIKKITRKNTIIREDRFYINSIGFAFRGQSSLLSKFLDKVKSSVKLPPGYSYISLEEFRVGDLHEFYFALFMAVILVFIIAGMLFNSLRYTFVIILSIPFGIPGLTLLYWVTRTVFDQYSIMGVIIASGIAVNDAILFTSYALKLKEQGVEDYISLSMSRKAKPIIVTTITTVATALPFIFFPSSELWFKLSLSFAGMLLSSTLMIILFLPAWLKLIEG